MDLQLSNTKWWQGVRHLQWAPARGEVRLRQRVWVAGTELRQDALAVQTGTVQLPTAAARKEDT